MAQERIDADKRAEQQRILAEQSAALEKKLAEEREENARKQAVEQERIRVECEAKRAADEQAKREADTAHKSSINRMAAEDLRGAGFSDEQSKLIVKSIAKGLIRNVSITY